MALIERLVQGTAALELCSADGARALVTLHGAHLVSWLPAGGDEQLYLSPRSSFEPGQAIRGGVPVVFPQFSDRGPLPRHGVARNRGWRLQQARDEPDGAATAELVLADDARTRAMWPHGFALALRLRLHGRELQVELHCTNAGSTSWTFAAALHTYLRVRDSARCTVAGLEGRSFWDAVAQRDAAQPDAPLAIDGEVDRVYAGVDAPLQLHDGAGADRRSVQVTQWGFEDVVVWNPGPQRCAALADMPADGYRHMLCIEAARIAQPPTLRPGQSWSGAQLLRAAGPLAG